MSLGVNCQVDEVQHHLRDGALGMLLGDHLDFVICCVDAWGGLNGNAPCMSSYIGMLGHSLGVRAT